MDLIRRGLRLASEPKQTSWLCPQLLLAEATLCLLIVWKVPYTEIDWTTYMQQITLYISGERDYAKIHGDTGPLVYPAMHVYIYRLLHYFTDAGRDVRSAQYIFTALYLTTLLLVMQCYRSAKVPPYIFPLLVASKRLHSIFLLRLFNDCWAVFFLWLAIWCYQRRLRFWSAGSLAFSVGVGVKMTVLLALPAVGLVLWQGMGRDRAMNQGLLMGQLQILIAYPFLMSSPRNYTLRAFDFSRQFLYKWTVNWRFVGEETFLSKPCAVALLVVHASLLGLLFTSRWLHAPIIQAYKQLIDPPSKEVQAKISRRVRSDFILTTFLSTMIVGCLCARSLHYQFYAYIAWSTPFLLWRSGLHPVLIYALWATQEWAFNVYPSTNLSSAAVVGCLALTTFSIWLGPEEIVPEAVPAAETAAHKAIEAQAPSSSE